LTLSGFFRSAAAGVGPRFGQDGRGCPGDGLGSDTPAAETGTAIVGPQTARQIRLRQQYNRVWAGFRS